MKNLFAENLDSFYDPMQDLLVTINFGDTTKSYKTHAFILASTSQDLAEMIKESKSHKSLSGDTEMMCLTFDEVRPELFEQCLKYAHTHTCDLIKPGPCNFKITSEPEKEMEIIDASCQLIKDIS